MRSNILTRLAAGTCGICFCYALAYQSLSGDAAAMESAAAVTELTETVTEPVTEAAVELPTQSSPAEEDAPYSRGSGRHGKRRRWEDSAEAFSGEAVSEQGDALEETEEDKKQSDRGEQEDGGNDSSQTTASGDPPTLSEFLSTLRCGGCRHGCSLLNPRCMKGRSKAESATVTYQETYGSDHT